jgi:hypothetical protein
VITPENSPYSHRDIEQAHAILAHKIPDHLERALDLCAQVAGECGWTLTYSAMMLDTILLGPPVNRSVAYVRRS